METKYSRKAWDVIAYTYEGGIYCPECVAYTDPTITGESLTDTRLDKPAPVFVSDELEGDWNCTVCDSEVF